MVRAFGRAFAQRLDSEPVVTPSVAPIQGGFLVSEIIDDLLWELECTQENNARLERRRRRRHRLLLGAVRPRPRGGAARTRTPQAEGVDALERNASKTVDFRRNLPKLLVIEVHVNGSPVRALVDTGSMADFVSTTLVDQLKLSTSVLAKPLPLQQDIDGPRRFDVVNLDNYDMILGTPWIYQHRVMVGLNHIFCGRRARGRPP